MFAGVLVQEVYKDIFVEDLVTIFVRIIVMLHIL